MRVLKGVKIGESAASHCPDSTSSMSTAGSVLPPNTRTFIFPSIELLKEVPLAETLLDPRVGASSTSRQVSVIVVNILIIDVSH